MKVYATPAEALEDAMRLSAAMTRKLAIAGLPFGGGKAVLAVPSIPSGDAATSAAPALRGSRRIAGRDVPNELGHQHQRSGHGRDRRAH